MSILYRFDHVKKFFALGILSLALGVVILSSPGQTGASMICCDLCGPNLSACLAQCGVDESCGDACEAAYNSCTTSCGVSEC